MKSVGDPCPYCHSPLSAEVIERKQRSRVENARISRAKALVNGTKMGRKPGATHAEIVSLRRDGHSYRDIAIKLSCSLPYVMTVCQQHGLNRVDKNRLRMALREESIVADGHRPWLKYKGARE